MSIEDYESAVLASTLDETAGMERPSHRMIAEGPRLEGSHPNTEIVVLMWDDSVGQYERRYRIWRDDSNAPSTAIPPPGLRIPPESLAMHIAQDLHS